MLIYVSVCSVRIVFLLLSGILSLGLGVFLLFKDVSVFLDWEVLCVNSSSVVMTFLFD